MPDASGLSKGMFTRLRAATVDRAVYPPPLRQGQVASFLHPGKKLFIAATQRVLSLPWNHLVIRIAVRGRFSAIPVGQGGTLSYDTTAASQPESIETIAVVDKLCDPRAEHAAQVLTKPRLRGWIHQ